MRGISSAKASSTAHYLCPCVLLILAAITGLLQSISSDPGSYHKGDVTKQRRHKKNICVTLDGVGKQEGGLDLYAYHLLDQS